MALIASSNTETEFDPDSAEEQSETALESLIACLEAEKRDLHLESFSQNDALAIGSLLIDVATRRELPVAIDVRRGEHILFHASLPGATPDNELWIQRKCRTTERYAESSLLVGLRGRRGGGRLENNGWFDETRYASHGGSVPIFVEGTGHVATATVSGLAQKADHDLVVEALKLFKDGARAERANGQDGSLRNPAQKPRPWTPGSGLHIR